MIKCSGFGKLLKQSFFISLISFFGLSVGCFASAGFEQVGVDGFDDGNFHITALKGGGILSNFLGTSKSLFALRSDTSTVKMWWRDINGLPYYYYHYSDSTSQGFPSSYRLCDLMIEGDENSVGSGCQNYILNSSSLGNLTNFFNKVYQGDIFYYGLLNNAQNNLRVCWNSQSINNSLCFYFQSSNLTGSKNYSSSGFNFDTINQNLLGKGPGQAGYNGGGNIEGESLEVSQSQLTGNTMYANCSKRMAFEWYRANGYKSRMCYSSRSNNNEIFSGKGSDWASNFVLTGLTYDDVYIDTANIYRFGNTGAIMSDINWLDYWRKSFEVYNKYYNNQVNVNNPFNGVPVSLFMLMGNIFTYGKPYTSASIIEFCDLSLYTSDYSAPYTGLASSSVCTMSALDWFDIQIANGLNPDDGRPGLGDTDGTVGNIGSSWVGITNRAGKYTKPGSTGSDLQLTNSGYQNGKSFMNNFFNSITDNFKFPEGDYPGVLPSYIIIAFCGIIIFRFLSH